MCHGTSEGFDADREQEREAEDDRGVAEGKPEAHGQRLAGIAVFDVVPQQLSRRVVDRGDVVRIERMPQTECVGENADADIVDRMLPADVVMLRNDQTQQDGEPNDM